ncbi:uncharacterized protein B0I36DRAFT_358016 [Microdochium trichocladiopsis]|uniref:Uncharacterized protein n=1 Tax=Microdochium trichocladiopsis TaxID=1682393 RepID=A0A9P8YKM8_9PEZI|nr:uncharacterized protein B0I36DRAFT_358016 [Microdochium trichocladiopsis]KAH7040750.1 hypothetical protein B0I36DRAFT_358016 [Microdochium trichocladiopsis]
MNTAALTTLLRPSTTTMLLCRACWRSSRTAAVSASRRGMATTNIGSTTSNPAGRALRSRASAAPTATMTTKINTARTTSRASSVRSASTTSSGSGSGNTPPPPPSGGKTTMSRQQQQHALHAESMERVRAHYKIKNRTTM